MDRTILLNAVSQKPAAAIDYIKRKGFNFTWDWYDMWKDAHARTFTVAKVSKLELLRDIRTEVERAITDGVTLAEFKKTLMPKLEKHGWTGRKKHTDKETGEITEYMAGSPKRLETIYRTNTQTAYMAGRYKGQMDAAADLPYLQYISMDDGKTRDGHRELHGKVYRADDPIWDYLYPPNDWGCRCRVRSLTARQVERMGLKVENSEGCIEEKTVIVGKGNKAREEKITGIKLPNGKVCWTGAGWNYNVGKEAFMPNLDIYHPADAKNFIREMFDGPHYKRFFEGKGAIGGVVPIAILPDEYSAVMGAKAQTIRLSFDNFFKESIKHKNIKIADLQQTQLHLDEALRAGVNCEKNGIMRLIVFNEIGNGRFCKTVTKLTADKSELYFLSMHNVTENHMRNVIDKFDINIR